MFGMRPCMYAITLSVVTLGALHLHLVMPLTSPVHAADAADSNLHTEMALDAASSEHSPVKASVEHRMSATASASVERRMSATASASVSYRRLASAAYSSDVWATQRLAHQVQRKDGTIAILRNLSLATATATQSSTHSCSACSADFAIDGSEHTQSHTGKHDNPWLTVELPFVTQIKAVYVLFRQKGGVYQHPPLVVMVDGVVCAIIGDYTSGQTRKVPCEAYGRTVTVQQHSRNAYLLIYDLQIEEEANPICPFLGALVNEGVLQDCIQTKENLLRATITAGLAEQKAIAHVNENFKNIPSGILDICNMEGCPCEHITSTGVNDCKTDFGTCQQLPGQPVICPTNWTQSCRVPNVEKFKEFVRLIDVNGDSFITTSELVSRSDFVKQIDQGVGSGTIAGSFALLLDVFGKNGSMHLSDFARVVLTRRYPSGYRFGQTAE